MTDPTDPLAHLYAEGLETDSDEIFASAVETSLERLNAEVDPERDEQISSKDVEELALLVKARLDADGGLSDDEAAELGLGDLLVSEVDGEEPELVLNPTGRAVLARLVDERFPGLRGADNGETSS